MKKKNVLLTGPPGVGKTTLVKRLIEGLKELAPAGFYTAEIREGGKRKGFELVGLDGRRSVLSHTSIKSPHRVGRYGVDVPGFESFLDSVGLDSTEAGLVIIDEIGKMECFSGKFKTLVNRTLDSEIPLIATIALRGGGLIEEVKGRGGVKIFEMTQGNRDALAGEIAGYVRGLARSGWIS